MAQTASASGYNRSRPRDRSRRRARTSAVATVESVTHSCGTITVAPSSSDDTGDDDDSDTPPTSGGTRTLPILGPLTPRNPRVLAAAGMTAVLLFR